ncbi:MAG: MerR family transcriptional regulator [Actinobacteria bacterium]|nr:MerR family transcriptional regulator [Actinomycetota bacterium]MBM3713105.1 MerR family transcriptional regulator [Actinomycetota bacterium]
MVEDKKVYLTIGELVRKFKKYYPGLTSSKLRFLESKGLIIPKRADNKYRVFFKNDVRKINLILKLQKEYFLPLEVIKEKIDSIDFTKLGENKGAVKELQSKLEVDEKKLISKKLTIDSIKEKYKLSQEYINELVEEGIISWHEEDGKNVIDGKNIEIIRIISELSKFGIKPKHLKLFENSAYRQSSFLQQVVYPVIKSSGKDSHKKASKILFRLEGYFSEIHEILFKKINKQFLDSYK